MYLYKIYVYDNTFIYYNNLLIQDDLNNDLNNFFIHV